MHSTFAKLSNKGGPIFGSWVTLNCERAVELLASLGHDYVGIDCQHSGIDDATAARLVLATARTGIATVVRVSSNNHAQIGRIADAGANGVIIPMVNTADEARRAVSACRYPPQGTRSFGPIRFHLGSEPAEIQKHVSCFVMVETVEGFANIKEICAVEGIAGVYVGPSDFAIDMGLPHLADPRPPKLREAMRTIAGECRKAGIIAAAHANSGPRAKEMAEDGFQMLTLGVDTSYLARASTADLAFARSNIPASLAERA